MRFSLLSHFWQWDDKDLELQADMDRFVEDASLEDNVESFLSHDDTDPRDTVGRCMDVSKGVRSKCYLGLCPNNQSLSIHLKSLF